MLGHTFRLAGRPKEAISAYTKAIRLNPLPPSFYLFGLGLSYSLDGQYEKGIEWCEKAVRENPDDFFARIILTAVYSMAGRDEEARAEGIEALRMNPKYSLAKAEKRAKYKYKDKMFEALRKAGLPEHPPLPLPDKPSIAVLAFDNLSGDPEQEYFADGMTDDLITDLSKISGLFVIAHHSAFKYKGKALDVQKISRELGIRYVLKGSVRRADNKIRINAQLIDATTEGHLWAERYDREQKDLFKLQNEILKNIVTALDVKLVEGEQAKLYRSATDNPKAYDAFAKGFNLFRQFRKDANHLAQQYLSKAIELDPEYAEAMGLLGSTHWADARYGWSASRPQSIEKGKKLAKKALRIDSKTYL
jgi:TolB-like protein